MAPIGAVPQAPGEALTALDRVVGSLPVGTEYRDPGTALDDS